MTERFWMEGLERELLLVNSDVEVPYIFDYDQDDWKKGYTEVEGKVSLHTISEMFGGFVTFAIEEKPEIDTEKYARIIVVPFVVTTGTVYIRDHDDPKEIKLEVGTYEVYFTIEREEDYDESENEYGLYFVRSETPKASIIHWDENEY